MLILELFRVGGVQYPFKGKVLFALPKNNCRVVSANAVIRQNAIVLINAICKIQVSDKQRKRILVPPTIPEKDKEKQGKKNQKQTNNSFLIPCKL